MPVRPDLLLSLRSWQKAPTRSTYAAAAGLPAGGDAGSGQDGIRADGRGRAAGPAGDRRGHRGHARPSTSSTSGHRRRTRWASPLDSAYRNAQGRASADFTGVAVTYAQVAAHPALHRQRTLNRRTLVIFDEIHHAGDALSWGEAVREAFEPARRRLGLTGTPVPQRHQPDPVRHLRHGADGSRRSASDYVYGYGPALEDGVVRPVIFLAYSGEMRWRTRAGDEMTGHPGRPDDARPAGPGLADGAGPRGRLDAAACWRPRTGGSPRSGGACRTPAGLVIAGDHADARAYAALLRGICGARPVVVLSDDPAASRKIARFADVRASGGWWRSGWSPRAWTSRGSPSGCTPPASARRCSSPRPSAASSGRGSAARPPRCSCRPSRCCWATPPSWRPNGTMC